jgi:hypothetical protein
MLETPFEAMNDLLRWYIVPLSFPDNLNDNSVTYPILVLSITRPVSFSFEMGYNPMFLISKTFAVALMLDVIAYTVEQLKSL